MITKFQFIKGYFFITLKISLDFTNLLSKIQLIIQVYMSIIYIIILK